MSTLEIVLSILLSILFIQYCFLFYNSKYDKSSPDKLITLLFNCEEELKKEKELVHALSLQLFEYKKTSKNKVIEDEIKGL